MGNKNETRSKRALDAVSFYVRSQLGETFRDESLDEHIIDILTDLMHLADSKDKDFEFNLKSAQDNFKAEKRLASVSCSTCKYLGVICNPAKYVYEDPCRLYSLSCPSCCGYLELDRTETILGVDQEIHRCLDCELVFTRDLTEKDAPLVRAVKCVGCGNLWPEASAHVIYEKDGYGHFLGECCWD